MKVIIPEFMSFTQYGLKQSFIFYLILGIRVCGVCACVLTCMGTYMCMWRPETDIRYPPGLLFILYTKQNVSLIWCFWLASLFWGALGSTSRVLGLQMTCTPT